MKRWLFITAESGSHYIFQGTNTDKRKKTKINMALGSDMEASLDDTISGGQTPALFPGSSPSGDGDKFCSDV
jgi:hypothetical protein